MSGPDDTRREAAQPSPLFALTRWSLVQRAQRDSLTALNDLFTQYRAPLLKRLQAQGCPAEQAEDLVQGFCAHLLGRDFLANVAPEKGRFRTWLLNALQNWLRDEHARRTALKRGEGRVPESLDATHEDGEPLIVVAIESAAADREFDRAWAQSVLTHALNTVRQEAATTGHAGLVETLERTLFAGEESPAYREIATRLGISEGAVKVAAHRIRQRLRTLIRDQVLQTVGCQEDWEDEVRYLIQVYCS